MVYEGRSMQDSGYGFPKIKLLRSSAAEHPLPPRSRIARLCGRGVVPLLDRGSRLANRTPRPRRQRTRQYHQNSSSIADGGGSWRIAVSVPTSSSVSMPFNTTTLACDPPAPPDAPDMRTGLRRASLSRCLYAHPMMRIRPPPLPRTQALPEVP